MAGTEAGCVGGVAVPGAQAGTLRLAPGWKEPWTLDRSSCPSPSSTHGPLGLETCLPGRSQVLPLITGPPRSLF